MADLSSRIRNEALRLGFFKTGITPAGPLPYEREFADWLNEGRHGEMRYLERQAVKRRDPDLVLADAKTFVIVAMNYWTPYLLDADPFKGRISRYAWGEDYHSVVMHRLESLLEFIRREEPSAHGICYVDTGPVMEKVWGARSSLGWLGKHTNLIARERGSWFFIGIILLDMVLDYDAPEKDYCGTCDRCIRACPTGAIIAPYLLDARLCISYLTIELRGIIPVRLRPLIGNRIFGCDDCQDVCPWNRFAVPTPEESFKPRAENLMTELASLIKITPGEFRERFRKSPLWRATRDGFVRNVAVALGNSGSRHALPALKSALKDDSPLVRLHAQWALEQIER